LKKGPHKIGNNAYWPVLGSKWRAQKVQNYCIKNNLQEQKILYRENYKKTYYGAYDNQDPSSNSAWIPIKRAWATTQMLRRWTPTLLDSMTTCLHRSESLDMIWRNRATFLSNFSHPPYAVTYKNVFKPCLPRILVAMRDYEELDPI
jgi:hypothetical protein